MQIKLAYLGKSGFKQYVRYTGYPGGQRFETAQSIYDKNSSKLIEKSVKGMLQRTNLGLHF